MHKKLLSVLMRTLGLSMFVTTLAMSGCTKKDTKIVTQNDVQVSQNMDGDGEAEPAAQTIKFDSTDFTSSLRQIHYAMPVTKSDIMDEASILIEGVLAEPPDMVVIDKCLTSFQEGEAIDFPLTSSIQKASEEYWPNYLKGDANFSEAMIVANQVFLTCTSDENTGCYASCETYSAIAAVLAGPKGLKHMTE